MDIELDIGKAGQRCELVRCAKSARWRPPVQVIELIRLKVLKPAQLSKILSDHMHGMETSCCAGISVEEERRADTPLKNLLRIIDEGTVEGSCFCRTCSKQQKSYVFNGSDDDRLCRSESTVHCDSSCVWREAIMYRCVR